MPYNTLKKGIDWNYESYHEYLSLLESKNLALAVLPSTIIKVPGCKKCSKDSMSADIGIYLDVL